MAFRVKVKLVEKIAKSHDGNVKVVKVISQKRIPGMTLKKKRRTPPKRPSQVREEDVLTTSEPVAATAVTGASQLAVFELVVESMEAIVAGNDVDVIACSTLFKRLVVILGYKSRRSSNHILLVLTVTDAMSTVMVSNVAARLQETY